MNFINCDDFRKVEIRIGTIIEVNVFPEAHNPAYKIKVDLGKNIGIKKTLTSNLPKIYPIAS